MIDALQRLALVLFSTTAFLSSPGIALALSMLNATGDYGAAIPSNTLQDRDGNAKQLPQSTPPAVKVRTQPANSIHFQPSPYRLPEIQRGREAGNPAGGNCTINWQHRTPRLTALIPDTSIGLTLLSDPMVFVYIPPIQERSGETRSNKAMLGEWMLFDQDETTLLYRSTVPLPKTGGIVSFRVTQRSGLEARPLELQPEQNYVWHFTVLCNQEDFTRNPYVMGLIRRTKPNRALSQALQQASPEKRANIYARAGIWYDALATLAEHRRNQPSNPQLTADWATLLHDVHLEQLVSQPLLSGCCNFIVGPNQ